MEVVKKASLYCIPLVILRAVLSLRLFPFIKFKWCIYQGRMMHLSRSIGATVGVNSANPYTTHKLLFSEAFHKDILRLVYPCFELHGNLTNLKWDIVLFSQNPDNSP